MAITKQVSIAVGFQVNQQSLATLNDSLDKVIERARTVNDAGTVTNFSESLMESAHAAQTLQSALEAAYNPNLGQLDFSKVTNSLKQSYGSIGEFKAALQQIGPLGTEAFNQLASAAVTMQAPFSKNVTLVDKMATSLKNTVQ